MPAPPATKVPAVVPGCRKSRTRDRMSDRPGGRSTRQSTRYRSKQRLERIAPPQQDPPRIPPRRMAGKAVEPRCAGQAASSTILEVSTLWLLSEPGVRSSYIRLPSSAVFRGDVGPGWRCATSRMNPASGTQDARTPSVLLSNLREQQKSDRQIDEIERGEQLEPARQLALRVRAEGKPGRAHRGQ